MLVHSGSLLGARLGIQTALASWNAQYGGHWNARAKLDDNRFTACADLVDRVFDGDLLPKEPGPNGAKLSAVVTAL